MKKLMYLLLFFVLLRAVPAAADPVSDFVNAYIKRNQVPGAAVLVRQNGKVVLSQGYGMANLEHNVPVKPETIFQSGSIGKQFTATAVMMLVDQKKLSVDDPVSKYLDVPETWSAIKIRHLLTHTSGLGDYPENFSMRGDYTEDDMLKMIIAQPLSFAPGEKWSYSNLGYVTLGILIRKVSGKFYGDFLAERVFGPLGMKSTRVISEADIIPNRAAGYELRDGVLKNQEWVAPTVNTTADGSLYFNVEDLAKWDAALESQSLLTRESYQQMYTPVRLNDGSTEPYGFGWGIDKTASGHNLIEHGGEWQGFTSQIARYVDDHVTVIVLCNRAGADSGFIAHSVAGLYNPVLGPARHTAKAVDPVALKVLEGKYRTESGSILTVTAAGGALIAERSGRKMMLIPESDTSFFDENSERTFRFVKDKNGKVISMIVASPTEVTLIKVE